MKPLAERLREDRRLVILRLLSEQAGFVANSSVLYVGLNHVGLLCTRADVLDDIAVLAKEALVTAEAIEVGGLTVVRLTARGEELVQGRLRVPGVSSPSPR